MKNGRKSSNLVKRHELICHFIRLYVPSPSTALNNDNEGSSVITQPLFWEDGKENRKYGLHRATIDVVPTHSYPTDSYMSKFTKSLMGGRCRGPPYQNFH